MGVNYRQLLEDKRWFDKRLEIIKRDQFICQQCSNEKLLDFNKNEISNGVIGTDGFMYLKYNNHWFKLKNMSSEIIQSLRVSEFTIQFNNTRLEINKNGGQDFIDIEIVGIRKLDSFEIEMHRLNDLLNSLIKLNLNKKEYLNDILNNHQHVFEKLGYEKFVSILNSEEVFVISDYIKQDEFDWIYLFKLNVHHTYYKEGKLPWEYEDDSMITLCEDCHAEIHEKEQILYLDKNGHPRLDLSYCQKCSGTGYIPMYNYYYNGICFNCDGTGFLDSAS